MHRRTTDLVQSSLIACSVADLHRHTGGRSPCLYEQTRDTGLRCEVIWPPRVRESRQDLGVPLVAIERIEVGSEMHHHFVGTKVGCSAGLGADLVDGVRR